jgi:hypothetical protein
MRSIGGFGKDRSSRSQLETVVGQFEFKRRLDTGNAGAHARNEREAPTRFLRRCLATACGRGRPRSQ